MESPHIVRDLALIDIPGLDLSPDRVSFFLGREWLLATDHPGMALWREKLFALMSQNSRNATDFFRLPPGRVVEMGTQVEL
jgi:KUP system potassium uptake protein